MLIARLRRLLNLRQNAFYSFYLTERDYVQVETDARFVLVVGSESFVGQKGGPLPARTVLHQNHPNPFNPTTIIPFDLAVAAHVELVIYNVNGSRVRTLIDDQRPPGGYEEAWDGRNARGEHVATGIYFYRLRAGALIQTRKMLLLK